MILDTSACLDLLLGTDRGPAVRALVHSESDLLAPSVLWVEVARVLRAKDDSGVLAPAVAQRALADLDALGVHEVTTAPLIGRAWSLRANMTIDDGVFVALADAAEQPLATTDLRLARAVRAHTSIRVLTHEDA